MQERKTYLYFIKNILVQNSIYIGITYDPKRRWCEHKRDSTKKLKNIRLYNAINKYGIHNFTFDVIESFDDRLKACEKEIFHIKNFKDLNYTVYNVTSGGEGGINSIPVTEETKLKLSAIFRGEGNKSSKLKEHQVIEIRRLYKSGEYSFKKLSDTYEVSKHYIGQIVRGECWSYLLEKDFKYKRPKKRIKERHNKIILLYESGKSYSEISKITGFSNKEILYSLQYSQLFIQRTNIPRVLETSESVKIKDKEIVEIKDLYKSGLFTQEKIGKLYNVNAATISKIVNNKCRMDFGKNNKNTKYKRLKPEQQYEIYKYYMNEGDQSINRTAEHFSIKQGSARKAIFKYKAQ